MEKPHAEPSRIQLKDLEKEYYRLQFLVEQQGAHLQKEMEVSMKAGEIVGRLYDAFVKQYDANDPHSLRYLNILCVRLVFCLYAEDAGVFGRHDLLHAHRQNDRNVMAAYGFPTKMTESECVAALFGLYLRMTIAR